MKANIWRITGYKGRNDYDGPADDNIKLNIIFDDRFKKEDVEDILFSYWGKKYRSVAIRAELLNTAKEAEAVAMVKDIAKQDCKKEICDVCEYYPDHCCDAQRYYQYARYLQDLGWSKQLIAQWKTREAYNDYLWVECSNCGFRVENYLAVETGRSSTDVVGYRWHACPKCTAKMIFNKEK